VLISDLETRPIATPATGSLIGTPVERDRETDYTPFSMIGARASTQTHIQAYKHTHRYTNTHIGIQTHT